MKRNIPTEADISAIFAGPVVVELHLHACLEVSFHTLK